MIFGPDPRLLDLDILLLDDFSLLSLAASVEPLRAANRLVGRPAYAWRLLSMTGAPVTTSSGMRLQVDAAFAPAEVREILLIVASFNVARHANPALLAKIRSLDRRRIPMGGIEAGTWVLALAGVLDGHRATTHWEDFEALAAGFPAVDVKADRYVIDGRFCTSGGAAPTIDLMLELVRRRQGLPLSLEVASSFVYDSPRTPDDPQSRLPLGMLSEGDPRLERCVRLMTERIEQPLSVATLARHVGTSTRTLETLFRNRFGQSPGAFYLALRLGSARRLVMDTRKTMTDIAVLTGFGSGSTFTRAFRARYGETPRAARAARTVSIGPAMGGSRAALSGERE